jgi:hypothetical protein
VKKASEYEKAAVTKSLEISSRWAPENDNPNTTQTPECTKDKYNVKILKRKVSPKGLTNSLYRPKGERKKKLMVRRGLEAWCCIGHYIYVL